MHGDPNGAGLPTWPEYASAGGGGTSGGVVAQIATSAAGVNVTAVTGVRAAQCAFWRNTSIPASVIWGGA